MKPHRRERLEHIFRDEITGALRELKDPRLGFVTLTEVKLKEDLRHIQVNVSVIGSEDEKKRTMTTLESAKGFIHKYLSSRIDLRFLPEVHWELDERLEKAEKVYSLLRKIRKQEGD